MSTTQDCFLPAEDVDVFMNDSGNVAVRVRDRGQWDKAVAKLAFPYSDPEHHVVLFKDDEEIGIIRDLHELKCDSRRLLREMLEQRYHIPEINRILSIEEAHNSTQWTVLTDRGERSFQVQDRDNFRRIRGRGIVVIDVDANRFRIPDPDALDAESRTLMDMYY